MDFSVYRRLLRTRDLRLVLGAGILTRMPALALPLVMILVVVDRGGGYGDAGVAIASFTVGMAAGAPWRGRLVDRLGLRRMLVAPFVATMTLFPALMLAANWLVVPTAGLVGFFLVPTFAVVRLAIAARVSELDRRAAFSMDGVAAEVSFTVGPASALAITALYGPIAAMGFVATAHIAGIVMLGLSNLETPRDGAVVGLGRQTPWLTMRSAYLLTLTGCALGALMATDVAIVATVRELDQVSHLSWVFIAWAVASGVGALLYGAFPRQASPTLLAGVLAIASALPALSHGLVSLLLLVVAAGVLGAPSITALSEALADAVPAERRGEAIAWQGTSYTIGTAIGAPLAGLSIDHAGAQAGFLVGAGFLLIVIAAKLVGATLRRCVPAAVKPT